MKVLNQLSSQPFYLVNPAKSDAQITYWNYEKGLLKKNINKKNIYLIDRKIAKITTLSCKIHNIKQYHKRDILDMTIE